jgi:hypothetical protein
MHQFHKVILKSRLLQIIICVTLFFAFSAGCAKPEPKTATFLEPIVIRQIALDGQLAASNRDQIISPDGKYLLAAVRGEEFEKMAAIPITEEETVFSLYSIDTSWTKNNLVQWYPIGWLSNAEAVFIVHGWQNQGIHKGERGTAVFVGNIESQETSLVAYLHVPTQGHIVETASLTSEGKLHLQVSNEFYEVDLTSGDFRLISDNFPNYYGISVVAVSPNKDKIVYSVYQEDKSGIYIMDIATGEEKPLLPTGETLSFFPMWSPDGKYIAAYTLEKVADNIDNETPRYNFIPGEDGPIAAAAKITIVDLEGNIVKLMSMEDRYLMNARWLSDSSSLMYLAGPVHFGKWGEVLSMKCSEAWFENIDQDAVPSKVADISKLEEETLEHIAYIFPVASLPDSKSALLNIAGAQTASVWHVSPTSDPVKVADGWWETPRLTPAYKDSTVGVISTGEKTGLYLVGPDSILELGESSSVWRTITAYNSELLIIQESEFGKDETKVTVYKMIHERVED